MGLFMLGVLALFLAVIAAEASALIWWRGLWRWAALPPLLLVGYVVLRIVVDSAANSTSHDLWPIEVLIWSFLALAFLGVLFCVRSIVRLIRNLCRKPAAPGK